MSGVVDPYLLHDIAKWVVVVVCAALLTVAVWACARVKDRFLGTTLAAVAGWVAALWLATFTRRHTRPREGD